VGCTNLPFAVIGKKMETASTAEVSINIEQAQLFRQAETERATQLMREIARLQADLKTAETALVEAESGLSGTQTWADAVSSLAVTRIQVERAAYRAPWRAKEVAGARTKIEEAERQVKEGRVGAALFFVYRAQRDGNVQLIQAPRVNLRAGPSTSEAILSVLSLGTPVFPQANEGEWVLVQVSAGPVGWIHRRLVGTRFSTESDTPAAFRP
jgi:hypothetical protein